MMQITLFHSTHSLLKLFCLHFSYQTSLFLSNSLFSTATTNSSDYHFWFWPIFITKTIP
eukprot:UN06405